ncbi:alanine racemase [Paenibacillus sp. J2TS4]|uniref:alanine racemase n=1 Tax=Paenibacillus sp. J2TS4 TaxID=2807194 RepID=UPI001B20E29D|nr:alanine racemase [Paenibacillus sp. J2TS4]GIP33303.1 alanine racemase [Paenibacillus sp. J2TS4]
MRTKPCHRHTWAEVHLDRIGHNIREIRRRLPSGVKFMAAVKADGYGHGAVQSANAALKAGADALAVGMISEALQLRQSGIRAPILVLSPALPSEVDLAAKHDIALTVSEAAWLKEARPFHQSRKPLRLHIKMDSGMGRIGIRDRSEWEAMVPLLRSDGIMVEGVYTHFATANQADSAYYFEQFDRFTEMRSWVAESGFTGFIAHCSNSAAALHYPELSLDMVRVGAALYGINPCEEEVRRRRPVDLQPVLSLHSEIIQVKFVKQGESIGYDRSYVATQDEWLGTVAIGYADGYCKGYQGYHMLVDGQAAPIAGNVCMDLLMIRLPGHYPVGTVVTLIGRQNGREITMEDLAARIGSIPQQVLTMLSSRVPRIYYNKGIYAGTADSHSLSAVTS